MCSCTVIKSQSTFCQIIAGTYCSYLSKSHIYNAEVLHASCSLHNLQGIAICTFMAQLNEINEHLTLFLSNQPSQKLEKADIAELSY